ncbi:Uncharacterised protein [Achromobacter sp. 2789STDY5608615]|uniref:hypothetical protein n=1 Tax=Achromobacter sp. 2789STDY5608615 TaxID=1806492 RepID=UPI0006C64D3A|nr:hypothetical protein [Achromobacter sp. 2789STDY5608615]CUJ82223.1 Uncharacterised protein [Achromobacter sp. 2789STDY5608615]
MAMNGSFAGGLADGLRNGMAIAQSYEQQQDRQRARAEYEKKQRIDKQLADAMAGRDTSLPQGAGAMASQPVQAGDAVSTGPALGDASGLQPVATSYPVTESPIGAQQLGLADVAGNSQAWAAVRPGAGGRVAQPAAEKKARNPLISSVAGNSARSPTD